MLYCVQQQRRRCRRKKGIKNYDDEEKNRLFSGGYPVYHRKKIDVETLAEKETQGLSTTLGTHDGQNGVFCRYSNCLGEKLLSDSLRFIPLDEKTLTSIARKMAELEEENVLKTLAGRPSYVVPQK